MLIKKNVSHLVYSFRVRINMGIQCCNCDNELEEVHDTLYSNIDTSRCKDGDHTGDIYECKDCDILVVDDFLSSSVYQWFY